MSALIFLLLGQPFRQKYITAEQTGSVACETRYSSNFQLLAGNWDMHTSSRAFASSWSFDSPLSEVGALDRASAVYMSFPGIC